MYRFVADPKDGSIGNGCATCCCSPAVARPGQTDKWTIDYAPWSIPLGGPGITTNTQFSIELRDGCPQPAADQPSVDAALFQTPVNVNLSGDLSTAVDNPGSTNIYSLVTFGGPQHGSVTVNEDGTFEYKPAAGYNGFDNFWWQVEVDGGKPLIAEAVIGVGSAGMPTAANVTPAVAIVKNSEQINTNLQSLSFALSVSPAAAVGCVYRLSVKQQAYDCDNSYTHLSCFDIRIGKC